VADRELPHLVVAGTARSKDFTRPGRGGRKIRPVSNPSGHGQELINQWNGAKDAYGAAAQATGVGEDELRGSGIVIAIEAADQEFPLQLDSLDSRTTHKTPRTKWALLSVQPATARTNETALVWVADDYLDEFLLRLEQYSQQQTVTGKPRHEGLVANMAAIRSAVLRDLWTSPGEPPAEGTFWWEVWIRRTDDGISRVAAWARTRQILMADEVLRLDQRDVILVRCIWGDLEQLPFTSVPVAEIRLAPTVDSVLDLVPGEQETLIRDLLARLQHEDDDPACASVCVLDTGLLHGHLLLQQSTSDAEVHTIFPSGSTADDHGHGTAMAGLALLGHLDRLLTSARPVAVKHRLESVRLHGHAESESRSERFPLNTVRAVSLPEISAPQRRRSFVLAITANEGDGSLPSTWSVAIDALSAGVDIDATDDAVELLGAPDGSSARLFVLAAGNRRDLAHDDYLDRCDLAVIHDPAQAWNALTVGAHTDLAVLPTDPTFNGWQAVAEAGDLSPYSSTGVQLAAQWPNKPDICMEGGNYIHDGAGFSSNHESMSLLTTGNQGILALAPLRDTSAATAQAARLAALVHAEYPQFWPETVRGLLVHSAEWTAPMQAAISGTTSKAQQRAMLRRYGWGVPSEAAVLKSAKDSVTLVVQDEFQPFHGNDFAMREFRLHELPWPETTLRNLGSATVKVRVTLSYFVEPNASRRGWRRKFAYQSHGLRFDMRRPLETTEAFVRRVNLDAERDEDGNPTSASGPTNWLLGAGNRNRGSLHADVWTGSAVELAECGVIAVHGVGGWWKNNRRKDRVDMPVRYALLVSLTTDAIEADIYTPIAAQIGIPVETMVATSGT
jgi:hypothetical protein